MGTFKNIPESSFSSVNSETHCCRKTRQRRTSSRSGSDMGHSSPIPAGCRSRKRAAVHLATCTSSRSPNCLGREYFPSVLDTSTSSFDSRCWFPRNVRRLCTARMGGNLVSWQPDNSWSVLLRRHVLIKEREAARKSAAEPTQWQLNSSRASRINFRRGKVLKYRRGVCGTPPVHLRNPPSQGSGSDVDSPSRAKSDEG